MSIKRMGTYIDFTPAKESYEDTVKDIDSMVAGFVIGIESMEAALSLSELRTNEMTPREQRSYNLALEHIGRSVNIRIANEDDSDEDGETGIWAFIKRIWRKVCDTFKSIWEKITNLFTDVDDRVKKAEDKLDSKVEHLEASVKKAEESGDSKPDTHEHKEDKETINTSVEHHKERVAFLINNGKINKTDVDTMIKNLKDLSVFLFDTFPNSMVTDSLTTLHTAAEELGKILTAGGVSEAGTPAAATEVEITNTAITLIKKLSADNKKVIGDTSTIFNIPKDPVPRGNGDSNIDKPMYFEYTSKFSIGDRAETSITLSMPAGENLDGGSLDYVLSYNSFPAISFVKSEGRDLTIADNSFFLRLGDVKKIAETIKTNINEIKRTRSLKGLDRISDNVKLSVDAFVKDADKLLDTARAKQSNSAHIKSYLTFIRHNMQTCTTDMSKIAQHATTVFESLTKITEYLDACVVVNVAR